MISILPATAKYFAPNGAAVLFAQAFYKHLIPSGVKNPLGVPPSEALPVMVSEARP